MRLAQALDRLDEVVALGRDAGVLPLELRQFLVGAQVDGAEPLPVALEAVQLRSRSPAAPAEARRRPSGRRARSSPAGVVSRFSAMAWVISARRCDRGLVARLRTGPRLAGGRRALRGRRGRRGRSRRAWSRHRRGGRPRPCASPRPPRSRRAARGGARDRCRALRAGVWCSARARSSRSPRSDGGGRGAARALGPEADVGRRSPPAGGGAGRPRARAPAERRAPPRRRRAARPRACALRGGGFRDPAPGASSPSARLGVLDPACRLALVRRKAREALLQGGAALNRAPPRAARRRCSCARGRVEGLAGLAGGLDGLRFLAGGGADGGLRGLGLVRAGARRQHGRSAASRSRSPRRFFSASRRAAAEGASAAVVKPSQRHRSPSRETRRWPGFELGAQPQRPRPCSTTPICLSRRCSAGGSLRQVGERA